MALTHPEGIRNKGGNADSRDEVRGVEVIQNRGS